MFVVCVLVVSVFLVGFAAGVAASMAWKSERDVRKPAARMYHQMHLTLDLMEGVARRMDTASSVSPHGRVEEYALD